MTADEARKLSLDAARVESTCSRLFEDIEYRASLGYHSLRISELAPAVKTELEKQGFVVIKAYPYYVGPRYHISWLKL